MLAPIKQGLSCSIYLQKRINKASKKIQSAFTFHNIFVAYYDLFSVIGLASSYTESTDSLKLSVYRKICNPRVLLLAFSGLKGTKAGGVGNVSLKKVILAALPSLSLELRSKKILSKTDQKNIYP